MPHFGISQASVSGTETSRPVATGTAATPHAVRWGAGMAIGGLVVGAIYLMIVRGDAILLDLSALARYAFCF